MGEATRLENSHNLRDRPAHLRSCHCDRNAALV